MELSDLCVESVAQDLLPSSASPTLYFFQVT